VPNISNELSKKAREIQVDDVLKQIYNYTNVNSYGGAKGDGVTDDTDAFQATINFASTQGLSEVFLRGGSTYLISGALTGTTAMTFIGDGVTISGTTLITVYSLSNSAGVDLTTIEANVATNTTNIETNTANIATNTTNITANSASIGNIEINQIYGTRW